MGLKVIDNIKLFTKFIQARLISSKTPKLFNIQPVIVPKKVNMKKIKKSTTIDVKI